MEVTIKDPKTGIVQGVDSNGFAKIIGVEVPLKTAAAINGDRFIAASSEITLTNDSASAIFFLSNDENPINGSKPNYLIEEMSFNAGASTGGSGAGTLQLVFLPKSISNSSDIGSNLNYKVGSTEKPESTPQEGEQGATFNGGDVLNPFSVPQSENTLFSRVNDLAISPGATLGFLYTPPQGNTSQTISFGVDFYRTVFGIK